jgi:hypothetical protein
VSGLRPHNEEFALLRCHGKNAGMRNAILAYQDVSPTPRVPRYSALCVASNRASAARIIAA